MSRVFASLVLVFGLLLSPPAKAEIHGAWTIPLPLGLPQFLHGKPGLGAMHAGIQIAGIVGSAVAFPKMSYAETDAEFAKWAPLASGSSMALGLSWFSSLVHGARLHELEEETTAMVSAARAWDAATRYPRYTPTPAVAGE